MFGSHSNTTVGLLEQSLDQKVSFVYATDVVIEYYSPDFSITTLYEKQSDVFRTNGPISLLVSFSHGSVIYFNQDKSVKPFRHFQTFLS